MKQENQHSRKKRADILLVSIGGGGGNALSGLIGAGHLGNRVDTLAMDTDLSALSFRKNESGVKTLQLGERLCRGRGTADPQVGEAAMSEAKEKVCAAVRGCSMVILITCLGGGTGTGGTPVLAGWLREMKISHKIVAQIPFRFEGSRKAERARAALEQLRQAGECVREVAEAEIREMARAMGIEKFTLLNYFDAADQVIAQQVEEILAGMGAAGRPEKESAHTN